MIDERYLINALRIQKEASKALELLSLEESKLKKINDSLINVTVELESIKKKAMDYPNAEALKSDVFNKLNDIELQSEILNQVIEPLNKKMESLRKEEEMLWNTVKEKYPNVDEEEIVREFKDYIEKNK